MSQAAEMVKWVKYRAHDVNVARQVADYVHTVQASRDRAVALDMLHNAISTVRVDLRVIAREAAKLNLCDCHHSGECCNTLPPF